MQEVEILKTLRHPNIIKHQDAFIDKKKRLNIRIEYANAGSLEELIRKRRMQATPLTEDQVLKYIV